MLQVVYAAVYDRDLKTELPQAWRVRVVGSDKSRCFTLAFARKRDAEAAMKAIENLIDWSGTTEQIYDRFEEFGRERMIARMVEAMQW